MRVKFKNLGKATLPSYSKPGDAGLDITATRIVEDANNIVTYGTDLAVEIPVGYVGLLFPRSSNSKKDLLLSNSVGVVDSGYRGELLFKFKPINVPKPFDGPAIPVGDLPENIYQVGDRIGQLIIIPYPTITPEWATELSSSDRGAGSFGSTGK